MKMKKIVALICAVACILGCFAGCGKQGAAPTEEIVTEATHEVATEATETKISEEAKLIMELMESYLNMEPHSNQLVDYSFGMHIKDKENIPVRYFEESQYTPDGDVFYVNSHNATMAGSNCTLYTNQDQAKCTEYAEMINNCSVDSLNAFMITPFSDARVHHMSPNGVIYYSDLSAKNQYLMSENYACDNTRDTLSTGFAMLPNESFYDYIMDMISKPAELEKNFKIGNEPIFYSNELSSSYSVVIDHDITEDEMAKSHDCYTVSFDVNSKYFNENYPELSNTIFKQGLTAFAQGVAIEEYNKIVPFTRIRLDDGNLKVKLYFDKDTKVCMGEKIDASACAGPMLEYINSLGWTEPTDNTFVIEKRFGYGETYSLEEDAERAKGPENYDALKNKIISSNGKTPDVVDVIKLDKYQIKIDMRNMIYEIWDGNNIVATAVIDYNYMGENMVQMLQDENVETQEHGDFTVYMNKLPMTSVFDGNNKNNEDVGYVAIVEHQPGIENFNRVVICAWDNDVLHDVVDHMTFASTNDPAAA